MKIFLSIMVFFVSLYSECDIQKGIEIPASKIDDLSYIQKRLNSTYTKEDKTNLFLDIDNCKDDIQESIETINDSIQVQYNNYQDLSNNENIKALVQNIRLKKEAIKDAKNIMKNTLKSIGFQGFFAVNYKFNKIEYIPSKEKTKGYNILAPLAVENLSKVYMETFTSIKNKEIKDVIKQNVSGKVVPLDGGFAKANYSTGEFFYIARLEVFPLDKDISKKGKRSNIQAYQITQKRNIDKIPSKYQQKVKNLFNSRTYKEMKRKNQKAKKAQKRAISKYKRVVKKTNQEIEELEIQLARAKRKIDTIFSDIPYKCNTNISTCIKKAQNEVVSKIKAKNLDKLKQKDKELIKQNSSLSIVGGFKKDISQKAKELATNIVKEYSKVGSFSNDIVIVNGKIVKDTQKSKKEIYRNLEKFYIYPIEDGELFDVIVVAKFLTSKNGSTTSYSGTNYKKAIDKHSYIQPAMVKIKSGSFMMGSNNGDSDEKPEHRVTIPNDFYIGKYEVTNEEFAKFLNDSNVQGNWFEDKSQDSDSRIIKNGNSYKVESGYEKHPIVEVSWHGAKAYSKWLSKKTNQNYRLPTEAEWEYVARAGTTTKYSFGDSSSDLSSYAWYSSNSGNKTHKVGTKQPNPWGVYDMHGNVWEWCEDWYIDNYNSTPRDGTAYNNKKSYKVLRGGSWGNTAYFLRSANRYWYTTSDASNFIGFRLVLSD
ncbi:MAG: formylglycine-generating enzyme family protein [Campylobacterota bacterium]|nr:formylglycine-generating enzyme family protein [Campylobacterota bacterium]